MRSTILLLLASQLIAPDQTLAQTPTLDSAAVIAAPATRDTVPRIASNAASASGAVAVSLVSTLAPIAIFATSRKPTGAALGTLAALGVLIGPSTGYWYAGSSGWTHGLILRTVTVGAVTGIEALAFSSCFDYFSSHGACDAAGIALLTGAAVLLVSDIYDIATLPAAVRRENSRRASVQILPAIGLDVKSVGVNVRVSF